jgi:membrane protein implicated in regulation of membrane protease activity
MELFGFAGVLGDLGWLLETFGPLLVAVIFFIWRDYRREDKLTRRIEQLENEQRAVILPLVRETTEVIVRNTEVMQQNVRVMERLEHALNR